MADVNQQSLPVGQAPNTVSAEEPPRTGTVAAAGGLPAMLPPELARSLEEADFNDVYLSYTDVPRLLAGTSLREAPANLMPEIAELYTSVTNRAHDLGQEEFQLKFHDVSYRASLMRTRYGEVWVLRRISSRLPDISKLGLRPGIERRITEALRRPGLVIVSGEVASGKSTTVAAAMKQALQQQAGVCFTIESPAEFPLQGPHGESAYCYQNEYPEEQFGAGIRRAMRSAPRFVMVGEIRTPEAASAAIRAALVTTAITTIHGNNVINTLMSIIQLAAIVDREEFSRQILGDTLQMVLHQKLERQPDGSRKLIANMLALEPNLGSLPRALIRDGRFEHLMDEVIRLEAIMTREEAMAGVPPPPGTAAGAPPPPPPPPANSARIGRRF